MPTFCCLTSFFTCLKSDFGPKSPYIGEPHPQCSWWTEINGILLWNVGSVAVITCRLYFKLDFNHFEPVLWPLDPFWGSDRFTFPPIGPIFFWKLIIDWRLYIGGHGFCVIIEFYILIVFSKYTTNFNWFWSLEI